MLFRSDNEDELSPDEVKEIVTQWRDSIISGLNLDPVPVWNEDYDVTPYYTNKPDWDALSALLLYEACGHEEREIGKFPVI